MPHPYPLPLRGGEQNIGGNGELGGYEMPVNVIEVITNERALSANDRGNENRWFA